MRRSLLAAAVVFLAVSSAWAAASPAPAAAKKPPRILPGEVVELKTQDGWTLSATYQESREDDRLTFVLLHEGRGRRDNWYWFGRALAKRGIGYIAPDLRGHGLSTIAPEGTANEWRQFKPDKHNNEYDNMRQDIAACVEFLKDKLVPEESIAVAGAHVGGSVALKYAALHPAVPMVILLSPGMSYNEVLTPNAMRAYRERPILFVVGDDDRKSSTESRILFSFAKISAGEENAALIRAARGHGTRLFYYNKGLIPKILDWIDSPTALLEPTASTDTVENPLSGEAGVTTVPEPRRKGGLPSDDDIDQILDGTTAPPE
ncbi:MAG: hypothetical protein A2X36_15945 [Elusimicrobia bacterium GWA2_69_24]|nr:MAG: hypothetical protein A2X36_15945 [Elusimicrobia bacterium GWA2_69_24]HBL16596.1 hypothetical protein [Elusimicrobiota bacterium]